MLKSFAASNVSSEVSSVTRKTLTMNQILYNSPSCDRKSRNRKSDIGSRQNTSRDGPESKPQAQADGNLEQDLQAHDAANTEMPIREVRHFSSGLHVRPVHDRVSLSEKLPVASAQIHSDFPARSCSGLQILLHTSAFSFCSWA